MNSTYSTVIVQWCDDALMMAAVKAAGWHEDSADSILDLVDEGSSYKERAFPSMKKAKDGARRNKALDFWGQPSIKVYQYPCAKRRQWQAKCVAHLRYVGDGFGWEELQ